MRNPRVFSQLLGWPMSSVKLPRWLFSLSILLALLVATDPLAAQSTEPLSTPGGVQTDHRGGAGRLERLEGSITLNGCVASPADFTLLARPLSVGILMDEDDDRRDGESSVAGRSAHRDRFRRDERRKRFARVSRTSDSHVLRFKFSDLEPTTLYQLDIRVSRGRPCSDVRWRGPSRGIVAPGNRSVAIEGFRLRTEIEVLAPRDDERTGRRTMKWVGADALSLVEARGAVRRFRWRTDIPGVTEGELQFSTREFSVGKFTADPCAPPKGLLHKQSVRAFRTGWNAISEVDLEALLKPIPGTPPSFNLARQQVRERRAPLYARVVPLRGGRPTCQEKVFGISAHAVLIVKGPNFSLFPSENPSLIVTGTYRPAYQVHPVLLARSYSAR